MTSSDKQRSLSRWQRLTAAYFILYAAVKTAFVFSGYNLFTEEAQYWVWSRYPDWSYYSKPPLIAWVNYTTGLMGHHDSIIRFTALAFGAGALWLTYKVAMALFNEERIACLSAILLSVSPHFVLATTFFTTDTLLVFFWLATGSFFIKAVRSGAIIDWIVAGVFFGLGLLSKYTMAFFVFFLIPLLAFRGDIGKIRGVVIFLATGAVLFSPVIYWNHAHDWVTVRHVAALSYEPHQSFHLGPAVSRVLEFAGGVVLINSPFLLYIALRSGRIIRRLKREEPAAAEVLGWLLVPVVGSFSVFLVISVFKRTEVNWASMSYLSIPIVLAYLVHASGAYRSALRLSGVTLAVVLFFLFPAVVDRVGLSALLPLKLDSMRRMAGWKMLAEEVSAISRQSHPSAEIVADSYHVASEISFYTGKTDVICINPGTRMNQFDVWNARRKEIFFPAIIYVTELSSPPFIYDRIDAHYVIPVVYRGKPIRRFNVFVLRNFVFGKSTSSGKY